MSLARPTWKLKFEKASRVLTSALHRGREQRGGMRYALLSTAVVLAGSLGCADTPVSPAPNPIVGRTSAGWMSATAEGEAWNSIFVTAINHGDVIVLEGLDWPDDESMLTVRLHFRADAGPGPQVIGVTSTVLADVRYDPVYSEAQAWSASGANGSGGTVTLTTLSNDRAAGTFSFVANALVPTTNPPSYRVTNGSFDVRLR